MILRKGVIDSESLQRTELEGTNPFKVMIHQERHTIREIVRSFQLRDSRPLDGRFQHGQTQTI
jgi:hypothetical protein